MSFTRLVNLLWAAGFVGNASLLAVLIAVRRWKQFPVFTSISAFIMLRTITLFLLSRYAGATAYYWTYWSLVPLDFILQICLLVEVVGTSFRPTGKLLNQVKLPVVAIVAGVSLAVTASFLASPPVGDRWDLWQLRLNLFTSLMMCELCALLSTFANRLGLQWKAHALAISNGYTAWCIVPVIGIAASAFTGWHREFPIFDQVGSVVYLLTLLYWSWVLSHAEQRRPVPDLELIEPLCTTFSRAGSALKM